MCNEIETCESKDHPEHKEIDENDLINENICCIELTSTESLKDEYLICPKNKKMKGLCKWMGLINGKNFVGILCNDNLIYNSFKLFDKIQAIKNLRFVSTRDVEIEKLHFIYDKIVNLDKITTVECVKFRTENKIIFDCSIIINLKLSDNNTKDFAGVVKWIGMINRKKCVGLDMEDEFEYGMDGTIDENNKFECMTKHGLITLLSNVKLCKDDDTLHYFDNGIINPNKIIKYIDRCNRDLYKEDIKINDSVIVNLNNGDIKLSGTLRCCGLMNKSPVCVIELNEDHENGTDGKFWRFQLIKCPDKRAIAVNARNIFKFVSDIDIMKRNFLEFYFTSNDVNLKCRSIKDLMKMEDKSILKSIICCPENPIDLVIHHDLLQILLNENEFEILKLLLRNCTNYNSYNDVFLNLSNIALSNDDDELFDLSVDKCTNKNAMLENGETFLTNLLKKNCNENIINKIIDKNIFDTNIPNKDKELPLILACERVMVSTVEKIVNNKTLYTHHKDLALSVVADAENKLSQLNRSMGDIITIVRLLTKVPTNNSMECSICFDNDVSLVFQCGHFSCEKCIEQIFKCPFCDQEIKSTMRVYLT